MQRRGFSEDCCKKGGERNWLKHDALEKIGVVCILLFVSHPLKRPVE